MLLSTSSAVCVLAVLWYIKTFKKITSLPDFYFTLASKRGVAVSAFRNFERKAVKLAEKKLDHRFFEKCLNLGLCPDFLKFQPPRLTAYRNTDSLYQHVVQQQLTVVIREEKKALKEYTVHYQSVMNILSLCEGRTLLTLLQEHVQRTCKAKVDAHNRKLFSMWRKCKSSSPECIFNYSDRELSVEDYSALYCGLKHHVLPKQVNDHDVKCKIENAIDQVVNISKVQTDSSFRDDVKIITSSFLNKAKQVCLSRINQFLHKTLSRLRNDKRIKICTLDKGNGMCILNTDDYYQKLDTIVLNEDKFKKLPVDLNTTIHNVLKKAPWLKKEDSLKYYVRTYVKPIVDGFTYRKLMPCGSGPGRLYGQAKRHKPGCPLRPVTSMIGTPEYHVAKWLDTFIKSYLPDEYSINSNKNFIDKLKGHSFSTEDVCVSFDVESLFTNVPLTEVITDIADTLFVDGNPFPVPEESKDKRLTKPIFIKLMALCTEGIFLYKDAVYQQIDGCAMGSPLGPTLANWFLGKIERDIFINNVFLDYAPEFYVRYVDDIFAVFDSMQKCEQFFNFINNIHPNLKFTVEYPQGSLPFLDIDITLHEGNIQTCVYRKSTNTGVLLNFNSVAPTQWKRSLITCLLNRAHVVCSNNTLFYDEIRRLKAIFISNSYPSSFFDSVVNRFLVSLGRSQQQVDSDSCSEPAFVYLRVVYVGGPSHSFGKRLASLIRDRHGVEIKVVFSTCKVGSYFGLKSRIPPLFKSNVVYKFVCSRDDRYDDYTMVCENRAAFRTF